MTTAPLGDYVFYGDESGDSTMKAISEEYPAFALSFCAFLKHEYITQVVQNIKRFKFAHWGHDMIILHGKKIRRKTDEFYFLKNPNLKESFLSELTLAIQKSPFAIISTGIHKRWLAEIDSIHPDIYNLFFEITLKKIYQFLEEKQQQGKVTHLVIESRMFHSDQILSRAFQQIIERNKELQETYPIQWLCCVNSCG